MRRLILWCAITLVAVGVIACSTPPTPRERPLSALGSSATDPEFTPAAQAMVEQTWQWDVPPNVPLPPVPADNPMSEAKFQLGRHLFYDRRLSGNATQACASCHVQAFAFTDGARRSTGSTGDRHPRNAQALVNVAWNSTYTWANPILTEIEQQVQIPMFGEFPVEMGITGHENDVLGRFAADVRYQHMFAEAFPDEPDSINWKNIVYALATFTRGLTSFDSP